MKRLLVTCATVALLAMGAVSASAKDLVIRFDATDAYGFEAPPTYGLRLDGVFGVDEVVTFHFEDVVFDIFDDDTALLHGLISVASVGGEEPGAFASSWDMNVNFQLIPDFVDAYYSKPDWEYFTLIPLGNELVNVDDDQDVIGLTEKPADGSKPFRIGMGVFEDHKCTSTDGQSECFGATSWVYWTHGDAKPGKQNVADFVFELEELPVPEPASIILIALGISGLAVSLRNRP